MVGKQSVGILVYRRAGDSVEVFLVHPGGPFWAKKDKWGIPKGEQKDGEDLLEVAKREFAEEVGSPAPSGDLIDLGEVRRSDGKIVKAWAIEGDLDSKNIKSNLTKLEWPPKSGKQIEIPEVDKAQWIRLDEAMDKIHVYQQEYIERLATALSIKIQLTVQPEQPSLF